MSCDICGKNDKPLVDLFDQYQTTDIKQICPECERIVNQKKSKLLTFVLRMHNDLLKRFMGERRAQFTRSRITAAPDPDTIALANFDRTVEQ